MDRHINYGRPIPISIRPPPDLPISREEFDHVHPPESIPIETAGRSTCWD